MQKNSAFLWRPFVQGKVIAASLAQAIEALNGADVILFCRDTGSKQGRPSFVFFFFYLFLYYSKTKTFI